VFSNDEIWMVMVNVLFSFHNPSNGVNSQYAKRQNTTKGVERTFNVITTSCVMSLSCVSQMR